MQENLSLLIFSGDIKHHIYFFWQEKRMMRTNLFCVPITTPATSTYVTNAITEKEEEKIQTFPFPPKTTTHTHTKENSHQFAFQTFRK